MRDRETAFIGKITAGVSHEFMNVLATIRESSGLLEDLLALDGTSFPKREKFEKSLAIIRKQVHRGMEIGDRLNRFAHSMDDPEARVEINQLLDQLLYLMQRFARLKQTQLKFHPLESDLEIYMDPFLLQMILCACLEYLLDRMESGGTITLHCLRISQGISIRCIGDKPFSSSAGDIYQALNSEAGLKDALDAMGARLRPFNIENHLGLELILPILV